MTFAAIIPDHGGREELIDFQLKRMRNQTLVPDEIYHVNFPWKGEIDLIARLKVGCEAAKADRMDWVFIIEDDFYSRDYFGKFLPVMPKADFIGCDKTIYYHLVNRTWQTFDHPRRSSLFCTAFKLSALNNWNWDDLRPNLAMVDLKLWEYARHRQRAFISPGAVGLKHSIGHCAGKGHQMTFKNKDPELKALKSMLDQEAFDFYTSLEKVKA